MSRQGEKIGSVPRAFAPKGISMTNYEDTLGLELELRGGQPDNFRVSINTLTVGSSPVIVTPAAGITLIVGGNNSGKSTVLKQVHASLTAAGAPGLNPPVLRDLTLSQAGTLADVYAWLGSNAQAVSGSGFSRLSGSIDLTSLAHSWNGVYGHGHLYQLGAAITLLADARARFSQTEPTKRRADIAQAPAHPLHHYEDEPALFAELDAYSMDIFGVGLTLDRLSGNLTLRFGRTDVTVPPVDAVTPEYREALVRLSSLAQQGDGVASTLGLLVPLVAGRYPIALVDEPEAFLHPPQAFKLGQTLARITKRHASQLIVATHDRDVVAGVLSVDGTPVSVVRLERTVDDVVAHQVEPEKLRELWTSPSLRHSNVLDGLFHRAVVIAENERDCVFYAAALEALSPQPEGFLSSDILFLSSHGLSGIHELANVLRAAHVPVVSVVDLDALQDKAVISRIVTAVGGTWSEEVDRSYGSAVAEFSQPRQPRNHGQVNAAINEVLEKDPRAPYVGEAKKAVQALIASDNPWREVKNYGLVRFRADRASADALVNLLDQQGVVLVRVGELEGFAPSLGVTKGPNWLPAALNANAHRASDAAALALSIVAAITSVEKRDAVA
jgi:hypothetical protein